MKKFLLLSALIALTIVCPSCNMHGVRVMDLGNRTQVSPSVPAFNAIEIAVPLTAIITVKDGATPSIQLKGYENLLKYIKVKVENSKLVVYSDHHWNLSFSDDDSMTAVITLPSLNGLSLEGSPDAEITGTMNGDRFHVEISGSSSVTIDSMNINEFSTSISGSGDLIVKGGTVKKAIYDISGSGDIKAFPLQSQETTASIAGSGDARVTALQKLTLEISGSGEIRYKGHPSISQSIAGSGSISDAN